MRGRTLAHRLSEPCSTEAFRPLAASPPTPALKRKGNLSTDGGPYYPPPDPPVDN